MVQGPAPLGAPKVDRRLLRELFLGPLREQKGRLALIVLALGGLAASQSLFLLLVGPFLKALFGAGVSGQVVTGAMILPDGALTLWPALRDVTMTRTGLTRAVPLLMLAAGIAKAVASYVYQASQQAVALFVARRYRERLFSALLELPYLAIASRSPADWMSVIMNDVMFLQARFSDITTTFVRDGILIVACLIAIAFLHWPTALVLLALAPVVAFALGRQGSRISGYAAQWQRALAHLATAVLDLRERFPFIRSQQGEAIERERFRVLNHRYYRMIRRSILVRSAFAPSLELVGFAVFAGFVFLLGTGRWAQGFGPAEMIQFFAALGVLLRPLKNLGEQIALFQETRGSLTASLTTFAQVAELAGRRAAQDSLPAETKQPQSQTITVTRLTTGYAATAVLSAHELRFERGETIAVIGPSGAGKSTLIKTLAGLLEPIVWQADRSLDEIARSSSLVSQTPFLFDDTLRANLLYGLPAGRPASDEAIWAALARVNAAAEIRALPAGLDTVVRSIGQNFSGGQIQRLVIARALLRGGTLWLLDEATSAVDQATERDITRGLITAARAERATLLAITHRLTWLSEFDRVWFVEHGRIALEGRHTELLTDDRYRRFVAAAPSA